MGPGLDARVLEPSPPVVDDGEWFADDPVALDGAAPERTVVPAGTGPFTWDGWLADHPQHAGWVSERWLGAFRRLQAPPPGLVEARLALHEVAATVVSPARQAENGKIGLRFTRGGFGTPFFGKDEQVRVEGATLVRRRGDEVESEPLGVDAAGAAWLGDWYGFAASVLEELRADPESVEVSRVQLWPEHFDMSVELLGGAARAGYGLSPGDEAVPEPYVYVVPWEPDAVEGASAALWNATSFRGAILPLAALLDAPDQRGAALAFLRECRTSLACYPG